MKKRDASIDLLRLIACMMVIGGHVNALGAGTLAKLIWPTIMMIGVTVFFVISGMNLYRRENFPELLRKSFFTLLLPMILYMIGMRLLAPMIEEHKTIWQAITEFPFKEFLTRFLTFSAGEYYGQHLWYMFTYFAVILCFPILKLLCKEEDPKSRKVRRYAIALVLGILLVKDVEALITGRSTGLPVFIPASVLTLIGYEIELNKERLRTSKKSFWIAIGVFLATMILRLFFAYRLLCLDVPTMENQVFVWQSFTAVTAAAALSTAVVSFKKSGEKENRVLSGFGRISFYVYLVHLPIYVFLDNRGFEAFLHRTLIDGANLGFFGEILYFLARIGAVLLLSVLVAIPLWLLFSTINNRVTAAITRRRAPG